jgi:hypothetical protein
MTADFARRAGRTALVAAATSFIAGVLHIAIIPEHWTHAPAHSLFFLVAGAVQIAWSVGFWRSKSRTLAEVGLVVSLALIALWALTRVAPAPFGHGPEEVDAPGLVTKVSEAICSSALATLIATDFFNDTRGRAWLRAISLLVVSLALVGAVYEVAVAAETLLRGLAPNEEQHHEQPPPEQQHQHSFTPFGRQRSSIPRGSAASRGAAQQLAEADPAGWRRGQVALPARMRDKGWSEA